MDQLSSDELRAVIAHEVAHLAQRDTRRRAMVFYAYIIGILLLHYCRKRTYCSSDK